MKKDNAREQALQTSSSSQGAAGDGAAQSADVQPHSLSPAVVINEDEDEDEDGAEGRAAVSGTSDGSADDP